MKRFVLFLFWIFICTCAMADAITINWVNDNQTYATTTCEYSDDVILPTAPTKYGYTFAGWESAEYIFVEYIEGLNNTQYIDTEVVPTSDINLYAKFQYVSDTQHNANFCFGTRPRDHGVNMGLYGFVHENFIGLDFFGSSATRYTISDNRNSDDFYEFTINNLHATIKKNGITVGERIFTVSNSVNYNLFLNALAEDGQIAFSNVNSVTNRIYLFKIDGVADMRPAIRKYDNAVGMYDVIRGRFFENAGTGAFTAGPVINE